jgi:hypothetical protein
MNPETQPTEMAAKVAAWMASKELKVGGFKDRVYLNFLPYNPNVKAYLSIPDAITPVDGSPLGDLRLSVWVDDPTGEGFGAQAETKRLVIEQIHATLTPLGWTPGEGSSVAPEARTVEGGADAPLVGVAAVASVAADDDLPF